MKHVHSHYENLRVARNAPIEVISAAYKALSKKYHPDHNQGADSAVRAMAMINEAYRVLSDQNLRNEHDRWIRAQEIEQFPEEQTPPPTNFQLAKSENVFFRIGGSIVRTLVAIAVAVGIRLSGFVVLIAIFLAIDWINEHSGALPAKQQISAKATYVRPANAPNKKKWPKSAAYLSGYKVLNSGGYSAVLVDNSNGSSDVYVKISDVSTKTRIVVRHIFIPRGRKFVAREFLPSLYDIRVKNLDFGGISKSPIFVLDETESDAGVRYSDYSLTLYKVRNGNVKMEDISESDF